MFTCYRLLPSFYIKLLCLSVYLLEFICLRIDPLALHLTCHHRALQSHYAEVMAIGRLHNDKVAGLDALTGGIDIYPLTGVLETFNTFESSLSVKSSPFL